MNKKGFTLLELLIVVGVVATLATVAVLVVNPVEMLKESRDGRRLIDIRTANLSLAAAKNAKVPLGTANVVYVSVPDTSATCANLGLPTLPASWTYACKTVANLRKTDGTGWIPVNLSTAGLSQSVLPIDPVNDASRGSYYIYVAGGNYALSATLESNKYAKQFGAGDGGSNPTKIEAGSDLTLLSNSEGLIGYWPFDEGTGSTMADMSGRGHPANIEAGAPTWTTGKMGGALNFPGSGVVRAAGGGTGDFSRGHTFMAWFNPSAVVAGTNIFASFQTSFPYLGLYSTGVNPVHSAHDGSQRWTQGTASVATNNWYFIVGVYESTAIKIYLDGVLVGTAVAGGTDAVGSDLCIGALACAPGSYAANGKVDDVRIYNRPFSATEIAAMYNAMK